MNRRDYEIVAAAFRSMRLFNRHEAIGALAIQLAARNARFDKAKFLKAAGYCSRFDHGRLTLEEA